jgi:glycosyltransferase involved in cell wall biosynthesis
MPVYNAGKYLSQSIDSICNQSFKDFEFIIIDDGSTDDSAYYLKKIKSRDSRIRIISRENKGLVASLNEGLSHSKGEYIARMDADDVALSDRFSKQVYFLDNNPDYVAVGTRVLLIDPEGWPICPFSNQTEHDAIDQEHLSGGGGAICHPALMARRNAIEYIGGYQERMKHAEDLDLFLRLAEIGKLSNIPEILLYYRMHPQSIGHQKRREQYESAERAVLEAMKRRELGSEPQLKMNSKNKVKEAELHQKWAWWAFKAGHTSTARKYALLSLKNGLFSKASWKVFICAFRG